MRNTCPYCGNKHLRHARDEKGVVAWCQTCGMVWPVEDGPGAEAKLAPPLDKGSRKKP